MPEQPWLDGYCVEKGIIRQFVAMPLGEGYTAEEQLTGAAEHGGLQILAYPMKVERYKQLLQPQMDVVYSASGALSSDMGLAPGGRMRQEIHEDPYGLDAWDQRHPSRCFVSVVNTAQWMAITGEVPPTRPPTAQQYTGCGLPWFEYYDADAKAVEGSARLQGLTSVTRRDQEAGKAPSTGDETLGIGRVVRLRKSSPRQVREGTAGGAWV